MGGWKIALIRFTSLTRHVGIGANSYLLELGDRAVLLDAGIDPKIDGLGGTPQFDLVEREIDALFLTHCHLDHIGALPVAMRRFRDAPVFMTAATARIGDAMLHNSINVMLRQKEELGIEAYPLYTHRETDRLAKEWEVRPVGTPYDLSGEKEARDADGTFEFFEAGHILGAVGIMFRTGGRSVFYTGDVHFGNQTITRAASFPKEPIDTVIVETTRGDAQSRAGYTRDKEIYRLAETINEVHARGGSVLIPVFALGKTQEILGILHRLRKEEVLPETPLYVGGLSTKVTTIIDSLGGSIPRLQPGLRLLDALDPFSIGGEEIDALPVRPGRIYALSSGMMTEKTLSHRFARRIFPDPKNAILFVGYSDPDSPSGRIRASQGRDPVHWDTEDRADTRVRCEIQEFDFSAHADRGAILDWLVRVRPSNILLVHGDEPAMAWFRAELQRLLPGARIEIPQPGVPLDL